MENYDARSLNLDIDKSELKRLYQTYPHRHVVQLVLNWLIISLSAYLSTRFSHPFSYFLAVVVIGTRMHALAILMHDAAHYRFLKNKQWNDFITNYTTLYWMFSSVDKYRQTHFRHHQHLNTEEDPDWFAKLGRKKYTFPKTRKEFFLTCLSYLFLIHGIMDALWFLKRFGQFSAESDSRGLDKGLQVTFYLLLVILLSAFGLWKVYLLYWVIPYFSTFFLFQYIRSVAEHFGELAYDHLLTSTRSFQVNPLEQFFFAPHYVGYHLEHHLYPGVPFYHLPKLHLLLQQTPLFAEKAHVTHGFWRGLMRELG